MKRKLFFEIYDMKILEVNKISKQLGNNQVLQEVHFEVLEWEIYGFLWPNGAGKTTTMKAIMGLLVPDSGSISVFGWAGLWVEAKKKIWFMPENTYLYKYLTGREFLQFNGSFFWLKWADWDQRVEFLLQKVWLQHAGDTYLHAYSKWMLQRIGLAQSIINKPKLLFLDEPMSGLDPIGRKLIKDLLVELRDEGTTIFFNTHILADVESICDKFSIIHKWKIVVESMKIKDLKKPLEEFFIEKVSG